MPKEIQAKSIYTSLVGNVIKVSDDMWGFIKDNVWVNEADTSDSVISISLSTFNETSVEDLSSEHRELYENLKYTLEIYFSDPEITEIRFHRNW